jgi:siroheme synthase
VWTGTIATLGHEREGDGRDDPGVIVIGEVVALAAETELVLHLPVQEQSWQPTTIPGL